MFTEDEKRERQKASHTRWMANPENRRRRNEASRQWALDNPERVRQNKRKPETVAKKKAYRRRPEVKKAQQAYENNRLRDPAKRAERLYASAKGRAKKFGVPFAITVADVATLLERGTCAYTGMAFDFSGPPIGLRKNPWSPSLDQIEPRKGYVQGNVEITSVWWNLAKNEWPPEVNQAAIRGLNRLQLRL